MISSAKPIALRSGQVPLVRVVKPREVEMAKGQQRSNREAKKPKKAKIKVIAAAPSQKGAGWQPTQSSGTKK
jgi:adenine/guanine phosphoribosyltransferase-like PRPP-binding protein